MGFDKLSFDLGGETVLERSVRAFDECPEVDELVIVTGASSENAQRAAARCKKPVRLVKGGSTRAESARSGVAAAHGRLVAVHDAARPFVSQSVIADTIAAAARCGAAAPAVPVKDTIKQAKGGNGKTVPEGCMVENTPDRSTLYAVQTPQCFDRAAYLAALDELDEASARLVTDDCSLFELTGRPVELVQGDYANIKITPGRTCPGPRTEERKCALVMVTTSTVWWRAASSSWAAWKCRMKRACWATQTPTCWPTRSWTPCWAQRRWATSASTSPIRRKSTPGPTVSCWPAVWQKS